MKHALKVLLTFALAAALSNTVCAAEKPQVALDAIAKLRTDRLAEAKAAGKRPDYAAISAEVLAKAKAAVKDADAAKVDLVDAQAWTELFTQAQDYKAGRTVAVRWAAKATGEEKFKAQVAVMGLDYRLKDARSLAKTVQETKPVDGATAIRLATLANNYVLLALTEADKATALKVLSAGDAALAGKSFSDDQQREAAKKAEAELAKTRKLIEDNPGKEAEAVQGARRAAFMAAMAGRTGSSGNTNAAAAAAAAREARDAKLAKFIGKDATDFKPTHTLGDFKGLVALKGKVVMLDFFAHWCGPCIASLPTVRALSDDLQAKGLRVVGVTRFYGYYQKENRAQKDMPPAQELERMKDFVKEKKMTWPVAFVDKDAFEAYGCSAIPHVVVIDRAGKIRRIKVGYSPKEAEEFRKEIEKLLGG